MDRLFIYVKKLLPDCQKLKKRPNVPRSSLDIALLLTRVIGLSTEVFLNWGYLLFVWYFEISEQLSFLVGYQKCLFLYSEYCWRELETASHCYLDLEADILEKSVWKQFIWEIYIFNTCIVFKKIMFKYKKWMQFKRNNVKNGYYKNVIREKPCHCSQLAGVSLHYRNCFIWNNCSCVHTWWLLVVEYETAKRHE